MKTPSEEVVALDRRSFLNGVAGAVLVVSYLPLVARASEGSPSGGEDAADDLVVHSSSGLVPHVHDLLIPRALLTAPPVEGVELETTRALLHAHKVALTREELGTVNQGGTVTKKASSHLFVIALAGRALP